MDAKKMARNLRQQGTGRDGDHACAETAPNVARETAPHHETSDDYRDLIARLSAQYRVILCKDGIRWILQRRDGERRGRTRWAGVAYFRNREALLRVSRTLCERIDPGAMAALLALPDHIGRAGA